MTKTIDTLITDIQDVLSNPHNYEFNTEVVEEFSRNLGTLIVEKLAQRTPNKNGTALRMSAIGQPDRKMWYQNNMAEKAEEMPPEAYLKFLYGDMIEELILLLAKVAGHRVTGQQDTLDIDGVKGHRDCVIDEELVDVKSASSFAYNKFKSHGLENDDTFHYLDQLNSYLAASSDVRPDRAHFLAVDKQLGKICLDTYPSNNKDYGKVIEQKREMLSKSTPPDRCYMPEPDGKSGNMKLGTQCSYCAFKKTCYPGLRTFLYANGPRFLTQVVKVPDVPEKI